MLSRIASCFCWTSEMLAGDLGYIVVEKQFQWHRYLENRFAM